MLAELATGVTFISVQAIALTPTPTRIRTLTRT